MAKSKRKGVSAGVVDLIGASAGRFGELETTKKTRKSVSPENREAGKPDLRKLTVDVPASVHDDYEDLYLELRRTHRKLKRMQYAPLVIRYGLDRQKIEQALGA